ncbi:hypothetical protein CDAR_194431 [Caerostris darwini]|uniref:Uncharacterized protein n=1 Tax=Caerostris darwini TaxID=1538125 RepID=A0AAV4TP20_9ARAC|nr:hypothetical protein CDAR_194431 [Caerostris darwini]
MSGCNLRQKTHGNSHIENVTSRALEKSVAIKDSGGIEKDSERLCTGVADLISHFGIDFGAQQFSLPRYPIEPSTYYINLCLSQIVLKAENNDKVLKSVIYDTLVVEMDYSLQISIDALRIRCDIISRQIWDWRIVYSHTTEHAKLLMSAEIHNLTYPLCRMKQEEIFNFLAVLENNLKAIQVLLQHSMDLKVTLMQHRENVLLKKILEEELHLSDMVLNLGRTHISLMQYDIKVKLHEMSFHL